MGRPQSQPGLSSPRRRLPGSLAFPPCWFPPPLLLLLLLAGNLSVQVDEPQALGLLLGAVSPRTGLPEPLLPQPRRAQWQPRSALLPIHDLTSAGTPTAAGRIAAAPKALLPHWSPEHPPLAKLLSPDLLSAPPPQMTLPFPSLKSVPAPFVCRYPASPLKSSSLPPKQHQRAVTPVSE